MLAKLGQILRPAHKRKRQKIQIVLYRPLDALPIPIGDRWNRHRRIGQIDPLGGLEYTARSTGRQDFIGVFVDRHAANQPILDQNTIADLHIIRKMRIGRAHPQIAPHNRLAHEMEHIADPKRHWPKMPTWPAWKTNCASGWGPKFSCATPRAKALWKFPFSATANSNASSKYWE